MWPPIAIPFWTRVRFPAPPPIYLPARSQILPEVHKIRGFFAFYSLPYSHTFPPNPTHCGGTFGGTFRVAKVHTPRWRRNASNRYKS